MDDKLAVFWSLPAAEVMCRLGTSGLRLSSDEAARRLTRYGPNSLAAGKRQAGELRLLIAQFKNPLVLILLFVAALSLVLGERVGVAIILSIVALGGLLAFWQERGATRAVEGLR